MPSQSDVRVAVRSNTIKSLLLVAGFPLVLPTIVFALTWATLLLLGNRQAFPSAVQAGFVTLGVMIVVTIVWLPIGYLIHQWVIDRATGARLLGRSELPRLWHIFEQLCRKAGMRLPALRIIETEALNAFASGLREGSYSVTVTRGLVDTLDDEELEAVLAHELAHIWKHDVRLLVIATVLVGIIPILHDLVMKVFWGIVMFFLTIYRAMFSILPMAGAKLLMELSYGAMFWAGKLVAYVVGFVATIASLVIHFALSRRREFMADAGAAELTGKPHALVSALRKISGLSTLELGIEGIKAMLFENAAFGVAGLFATHPPIEARIAALENLVGLGEPQRFVEPERPPVPPPRGIFESASSARFETAHAPEPFAHPEPSPERRPPVGSYFAGPSDTPDPASVARYLAILNSARPAELDWSKRQELYRRARNALDQSKDANPPVPMAKRALAELNLEEAIRQLEASLDD